MQRVEQSLRDQERTLAGLVNERLDRSEKATGQVVTDLRERLARIDEAQKKIGDLSTQVVSLQQILTNKQARGAFGEVQLNDLVSNALPPSAYALQCTLSNGSRVDCLLKLPNPPGSIAIDAKFPLESYHLLRAVAAGDTQALTAAQRAFQAAMRKHITDIRDKYIVPGETAESALLFLPSEAIYAELHANFGGIVDESYRARVWIVSPTTMMATLNTVRAVLKDVQMREQAGEIQKLVGLMMGDTRRLQERVDNLKRTSRRPRRTCARSTPRPRRSCAAASASRPSTWASSPRRCRKPLDGGGAKTVKTAGNGGLLEGSEKDTSA